MRFESKHSYFKRCVRYSQIFKNVCATLAERHLISRETSKAYFSGGDLFPSEIHYNCGSPFNAKLYNGNVMQIVGYLGFTDVNTVVCTSAAIKGCQFQKHLLLLSAVMLHVK